MFRPEEGQRGWTLIEIVISTAILLVVLVGFSYGLVSSTSLGKATREQGTAREAARGRLEEMRATAFEEVLARYATGTAPGPDFDVLGLAPRPDDPDGHVGKIVFPLSDEGELREDLELPRLGMPHDLTGDGEWDELDHAADYRILPVLVRLEWQGASGGASFEMLTLLKRMRP
jgi:prepilin-type N-terminal cleavage/methylation domain-containing protein